MALVKSFALYAFLLGPVAVLVMRIDGMAAMDSAADPRSLAEHFLAGSAVALVVLLATIVWDVLEHTMWRFTRRNRAGSTGLFELIVGRLGVAFLQPFHAFIGVATGFRWTLEDGSQRPRSWQFGSWVHFIWAIALIGYLTVGFLALRFGTVRG